MNLANFVDENGEHRMRGMTTAGVPGAQVVVREFNPRTRQMTVIYEGPLALAPVTQLGHKGSTIMLEHD